MFKLTFVCCAFESKCSLRSFPATPTLIFAHVHLYTLNVWLVMWVCSSEVESVLLTASISFLSPVMLSPSRNSDRNKTITRYRAIIQFWRLSIANEGERNIDKKLLKTHAWTFEPFFNEASNLILTIHLSLTLISSGYIFEYKLIFVLTKSYLQKRWEYEYHLKTYSKKGIHHVPEVLLILALHLLCYADCRLCIHYPNHLLILEEW